MFYTVYLSFEEDGRNYIGKHTTHDPYDNYLGSFKDETFAPTNKIILEYATSEEGAINAEMRWQRVFQVVEDSSFANLSYQTSNKFYFDRTGMTDSEETFKKRSAAQKGNKNGLGNKSKTGQTNSQTHREIVSRAMLGNNWGSVNKGKPKPQRFRDFMKGNQHAKGMKWWVNDLGETIFQESCPGEGWQRGRKWQG